MFHIVFDSVGAQRISVAMDLDEALDGEIVLIRDDYSVGPIKDLFSEEGQAERWNWWTMIRAESSSELSGRDTDTENIRNIVKRMEEEEFDQIWIWVAPNIRDVAGYFWLISQLSVFTGRIYVVILNNLPFINEKGNVFYPSSLSEIPAREFIKARKLARPVSAAEFDTDTDDWLRLASENKNLRLLDGGKKIIQQPDEYYDRAILNFLQPVFQKLPRVAHQFMLKSAERINESFLYWRLKQLVASGAADQQGETIRLFVKAADQVDG